MHNDVLTTVVLALFEILLSRFPSYEKIIASNLLAFAFVLFKEIEVFFMIINFLLHDL